MTLQQEKEDLVLAVGEDNDENLAAVISDLYVEVESSAGVIESCARHFGWLGWDPQAQGEKANDALERAGEASDEARRGHAAKLCEVLENERQVLEQYRELLAARRELLIKRMMVESRLRRIDGLLSVARPYCVGQNKAQRPEG
jgi:hypothetical protein